MPLKLDIPDPFEGGTTSNVGLDIEDPFKEVTGEQAIPTEEKKPADAGLLGNIKAAIASMPTTLAHGIPAMVAGGGEFALRSAADIQRNVSELVRPSPTYEEYKKRKKEYEENVNQTTLGNFLGAAKEYHQEQREKYLAEHPEYTKEVKGEIGTENEGKTWREPILGYQTGEMMTESLVPIGGIRKVAMTGATKLIIGASAARKAATNYMLRGMTKAGEAKLAEASALSAQYMGRQAIASKLSNVGTAGLFGLSQAQQTVDNAREQGVDPGIMPYLTGLVEGIGEYYGTKYLTKLFKVKEGSLSLPSLKEFFKTTFGVEVSTEMLQNGIEAAIEKYSGIRPSAEPIKEAISAIAPTSLMAATTFGVAAGAHYTGKTIDNKVKQWNDAQKKSAVPFDMSQPTPSPAPQTTFTPRAVEQPQTRAEKEYSDWWAQEMQKEEAVRQSPEGRQRLAEELAVKGGRTATVLSDVERERTRKAIEAQRYEEETRKDREHDQEIEAWKKTTKAQELQSKMEGLKKRLVEERVKTTQTALGERLKAVAAASSTKRFQTWLDTRVKEMNTETEGSGDAWLNQVAESYDVKRESKNFAAQLKRGITAEATILGIKVPPQKVKEVAPVVEKPVVPVGEVKPYTGLTPGTKEWKKVWKANPELQKEMGVIAKQVSPTEAGLGIIGEEGIEEPELLPKHQAIKLVNKVVTPQSSLNDVMDIFDGVDHIAVNYGMSLSRKFQNLNDDTTRKIAQKIQEIWRGVSGGILFRDMANANEDIKQKIATTNQVINEMSEGAPALSIPASAVTPGRPSKARILDLKAGEIPTLPEQTEETTAIVEDVAEQIQTEEPTEAEVKELNVITEKIEQEIEKVEKRIEREKTFRQDLQTYIKARRTGVDVRGKTWEELDREVEELLEGLREGETKEITWKVEDVFDDILKSEKLESVYEGALYLQDAKEWQFFFDLHTDSMQPIYAPGRAYDRMIPGSKEWIELIKQRPDLQKEMVTKQRAAQEMASHVVTTNGEELLQEARKIGSRHTEMYNRSRAFPFFALVLKNWGHILRGVKVYIIKSDSKASYYSGDEDSIYINIDTYAGTSPDLGSTIMHECGHAISANVLRHDKELQKQFIEYLEESLKHTSPTVKSLIASARAAEVAYRHPETGKGVIPYITSVAANHIKHQRAVSGSLISSGMATHKDWEIAYAHSDLQEFIACIFDSPNFRHHLNSIKLPGKPAETMYQKIIRAIHLVLTGEVGIDKNYSMLDKVMESTGDVFNNIINIDRKAYVEKTAQGINVYQSFNAGQIVRDIKDIGETNLDIKTWQKYIPMHILGKYFGSAKKMLGSWQEGQRILNKQLYQYEYTVDPTTGKERTKSFLTLSHPLKPNTPEQKLFDRMSYEGDLVHRDQSRADLERFNREMGLNLSNEQLTKVEHAYNSIREHYTRFWNWYWDNVQKVAVRPFERKVWYTELVETMLENNTQITAEVERDVKDQHGDIEFRRFVRARESMLKAWDAIAKSRASMVAGYAPRMRQQGAYRVNVKNAAGDILATKFATNRLGAAKLKYQFEKEYPNQAYESFHTSTSPENIFSEFDKHDLESFINTITNIMERTGEADELQVEEFYQALASHIANKFKPTGFRTHQIQRVGQAGESIQGYKTDNYHENFLAYIRNGAGSVRKMNFAFDANNILRDIEISKKEGQSELFLYLKQYRDDMLRNEIAADKFISNVRSIAFLYYLAANIKSSVVNATQNFILGIPIYARAMHNLGLGTNYVTATKELHKAMADIFKLKMGKKGHLTAEELDLLNQGRMDGDTGAMQMSYMSGAMDRSMGSRYTYLVNLLGTPFSVIETVNREAAMLAFYRLYRNNGMPEGMSYIRARDRMYDVHFPYGKHNYPELVRAKGVLGQIGHLLSTFRSYTIMYVSTILESFRGTDGKVSWRNADVFFGSIALLVLLGGLSAPWVDDILDTYERMTGRPIRSMIRERLRRFGGDRMAWAGMHGLPALLGVDITGSLKIGVPLIGAGGIEETITGAYAGLEQKIGKGAEAWSVDNYYRALEEWSPTFLSNAMKAVREASQGATNLDGTPVTDPEMNQYRPNLPEAVLQGLGFRIERRAEISEEQRTYRNTQDHMAKRRDNLYTKYRMADTDAERAVVSEDISEYNDDANELGNSVPSITNNSLRRAMSDKFDRRRFLFQLLFNEPAEDVR